MKSATLLSALILAITLFADPATGTPWGRPARPLVCYTKFQRCCFRFSKCGYVTRRVKKHVPCPKKKCVRKCELKCKHVTTRKPRRVCHIIKKRSGVTCKNVERYPGFGYGHKRVCTPRFTNEKKCKLEFVRGKERKCHRVCRPHCTTVHAICVRIHILRYAKLCAKEVCGAYRYRGNRRAPAHIVSKRGKLVKVINGPRVHRR